MCTDVGLLVLIGFLVLGKKPRVAGPTRTTYGYHHEQFPWDVNCL
jgi:hypothetical protein